MSSPELDLAPFADGSLREFAPAIVDGTTIKWQHTTTGQIIRQHEIDEGYFDYPDATTKVDPIERITQMRDEYEAFETVFGVKTVGFAPVITTKGDRMELWVVSRYMDQPGWIRATREQYNNSEQQQAAARRLHTKLVDYWLDRKQSGLPVLIDMYHIRDYLYDSAEDEFILVDTDPYMHVWGENQANDEATIAQTHDDLKDMAKDLYAPDEYCAWESWFDTASEA